MNGGVRAVIVYTLLLDLSARDLMISPPPPIRSF
jgi:hypothetical protein